MRETDVLVVGGGPAGLAAALAARRSGLGVVLADRARPPIDKACGEGLMPDALAALYGVGAEPDAAAGIPFHGIRFVDGGLVAEATFAQGHGLGLRRTLLHRMLAERAQDAGVTALWGTSVDLRGSGRVELGGCAVSFRWLIGADGSQSRVRQWAGLPSVWSGVRRFGLRQHFRVRPWSDVVEVHWGAGAQAYVTPVAADEICIALLGGASAVRLADLPGLFPALARRLAGAAPIGPVRGALSMSTKLRRVTRGSVALIGDASGAVDAITGEGLALAFRQACILGPALAAGSLAPYETAHRRLRRMPLLMARLLLLMDKRDGLRRRALRALAAQPRAFEHLLALHVGRRCRAGQLLEIGGFGLRLLATESGAALASMPSSAATRRP
jgi:flavin-dependent dehydrogenase